MKFFIQYHKEWSMDNLKHSIMIIDDHPIIQSGIRGLLSKGSDLEITATATSSSEALEQLESRLPDLAIVDLSLGDSDGADLIQCLKAQYPNLRILVYTMSEEKLFAERVADAGADGYVMKTSPPPILRKAIRTVLAGNRYFSPGTMRHIQNNEVPEPLMNTLSSREMDVFRLIGKGQDAAAIATKLNICHNTVDTHRINIKNKLGLPNGKALDRLAYEIIQ
jgi:two-component system response regulator NreC